MILTAAYCIVDEEGNWSHNMVFAKGYSGMSQNENIVIRSVAVRKEWTESSFQKQSKNRIRYKRNGW